MTSLDLKQIAKGFANKSLYSNLSFNFKKGCYAIVGPNGVGKTVLLEMLAGVLTPDTGEIFLDGAGTSISLAYKRELAYIPSKPEFFPSATGKQFLDFITSINSLSSSTHNALLPAFNLTDYLSTKFSDMSLGTQKKLFLSTLAIGKKSLYVLDEPSNGLDSKSCLALTSFLRDAIQHAIVIMATHDQTLLNALNPTIIKLSSPPTTNLM